ncbi:hypothetical protein FPQ18DRAFT_306925 [Pyronema domesticum]|nr:hypothetical protein FPQ18DRAFT_306925 [Pyronema domesticum]
MSIGTEQRRTPMSSASPFLGSTVLFCLVGWSYESLIHVAGVSKLNSTSFQSWAGKLDSELALARERDEQREAALNAGYNRVINLSLERAARIQRGEMISAFGSVEFDLWADEGYAEGSAVASAVYSTGSANANECGYFRMQTRLQFQHYHLRLDWPERSMSCLPPKEQSSVFPTRFRQINHQYDTFSRSTT